MSLAVKELLSKKIYENQKRICAWYEGQAKKAPPPFYSSIDLRESHHKIVPVDCNLFPAGFNNICEADLDAIEPIVKKRIQNLTSKKVSKILLIPEMNTKNLFYAENLDSLVGIFERSGFETRLGWMDPATQQPVELSTPAGKKLLAYPIQRKENRLLSGNFDPDVIILNNDFSSGHQTILDKLEQPVHPNHFLGWNARKKETHFKHYNDLAREFAELIKVDPWIISIETHGVEAVDFNHDKGIETAANEVEKVLEKIRTEYRARNISEEPAVFVKNNRGTYGMGVMVVRSGEELRALNRREKNKMSVGKNRLPIDSVIVQEAVPTEMTYQNLPAEPVIYVMGCDLIGGFLRANTERGQVDNLNSKGMVLRKLCVSELEQQLAHGLDPTLPQHNRVMELVYGTLARLASLAAGREAVFKD